MPWINPVSCTGKNPFGITTYRKTVSASVATATSSVGVWRSRTQFSIRPYQSIEAASQRCVMRVNSEVSSSERRRSSRAHIIGTRVSDTTAEMTIVTARVIANSRNSRPTTSGMNKSGISTAISETVSEMIVNPIWREPRSAARIGVSPPSIWRAIFSIMTIASSTTKPAAIVIAISDRLLRLNPARYITPKVPTSDSGTDRLGMIVPDALPRNRKITSTTRTMASTSSDLDRGDRGADRIRTVAQHHQIHSRRQRRPQPRQQRLDAIDDVDDIGAGLALDGYDDRRLGIHPAGELCVLGPLDRGRDIGQANRRPVAIGDHQIVVIGRAFQLVVGVDRIRPARPVEAAFRRVDIGVADRRAQIVDIEAVSRQLAAGLPGCAAPAGCRRRL